MAKQTFTAGQVLTAAQMNSLQANDYNWTVDTKTDSYTLVAGDAGKRIVMNAATAKTITVNTSVFTAGDVVWIHNINTGTCTVTAGTATVNTAGSLALAQWEGGVLYFTSAASAIFFRGGGTGYGVATGGSSSSITVDGKNYTLLTFTGDDNLTVSKTGLFDVLIFGGGGAGGAGTTNPANSAGGGGGGGGKVQTTVYLTAATYAIKVGAGGAYPGTNGAASYIAKTVFMPGGGGGGGYVTLSKAGSCGAGGQGQSGYTTAGARLFTDDEGYAGGNGFYSGSGGGGGGGGTGSAGVAAASNSTGGNGGNGTDVSTFIAGATNNKGGGAGGGASTTGGTGNGGGGNGSNNSTQAAAPAANSAGGGGGSGQGSANNGRSGGSGIVYVRFQ